MDRLRARADLSGATLEELGLPTAKAQLNDGSGLDKGNRSTCPLLAAVIAVAVGPLLEELLFRGFLQPVLAQVAGARGGLVLSSALFASLHGAAGLPMLFALSLFLGWLQLRTRNLAVPWSAHALHNGVSLALALAGVAG